MTDKQQLHLQIHFAEKYQPITDDVVKTATLELCPEQIRSGIIRDLTLAGTNQGVRNFTVLLAIAAFMNSENKAFPSQATLADITGYSRATVNKAIQDLCQLELNGQKVLEKKKIPAERGHSKTVYKFTAVTDSDLVDFAEMDTEAPVAMTAKDVISLFCKYFEDTFNTKYMPNWGKDSAMVKQKLMGTFTDDELRGIVRIAVTEYSKRWANRQYPTPTIGQLCTWLSNEANKVLLQEKQQEQQMQDRIAEADKYRQIDSAAMLDEL